MSLKARPIGHVLGALARRLGARDAPSREAELADALRKLSHDLRGALSPALLLAERLESHADPAVAQAASGITRALDRASALTVPATALARSVATSNAKD